MHEVLGFFLELHVGVADQAEQARALELEAGEQAREEHADEFFQHDETDRPAGGGGQADEAVDLAGQGDEGGHVAVVIVAGQGESHDEAHVGDEGEGMRRVHRQRGEHGEDALHEVGVEEMCVVRRKLGGGAHDHAGTGELGAHMREGGLLGGDKLARAGVDLLELLGRAGAVGGALQYAGAGLADEAGDADGVEFIEVGGADGDEAQPLKQRVAGILGLGDHAEIEVQPGKLAVDEAGRVVQADFRRGCSGDLVHTLSYTQTMPIHRPLCTGDDELVTVFLKNFLWWLE